MRGYLWRALTLTSQTPDGRARTVIANIIHDEIAQSVVQKEKKVLAIAQGHNFILG